jgi:D-threo-aldose 1-dehydrogenase
MPRFMKLTERNPLGNTGLTVPPIVYGTSYLGNLYRALPYGEKLELMRHWFVCTESPVVIDTAGKYGAGLALETLGRGLSDLGLAPGDILISNKLGWYRVPLAAGEPTFEPGVWKGLAHDCVQIFGYEGIRKCYEQGNELLGGTFRSEVVSVHDPDEYLLAATGPQERDRRLMEILESYRALFDLKAEGRVRVVGIGAKDWTVIRELYAHVPFDWVMLANSFTLLSHPPELLEFMDLLSGDGVGIINSALFHGGFLTGGDRFDYRRVDPASGEGSYLHAWRKSFRELCEAYGVEAGDACLHFGRSHPAIASIALNTSKPQKMLRNVEALLKEIPASFWKALKKEGLIDPDYAYL